MEVAYGGKVGTGVEISENFREINKHPTHDLLACVVITRPIYNGPIQFVEFVFLFFFSYIDRFTG